ncbi:hypothetical protein Tco_0647649 [Tanacetum coccineum]
MSNTTNNMQTHTSSALHNNTVSLCSVSNEEEIQRLQEKARLSKGGCMNSLKELQSHFTFFIDTLQDFGQVPIFKSTFSQDMDLLEQQLTKEIPLHIQKYTRFDAQSFKDKIIGDMDFIEKYMLETILHQQEIHKLVNKQKLLIQEFQSNTIQELKVDTVVLENTYSGNENSNSESAFSKLVKESSLDSATKDVHAIKYKMSKAKERCVTYFQSLHSHLQVLSKEDLKGTCIEHGFKRAFMSLFGQDDDTFTSTMFLNFQKFIDLQFSLDYDSQMTNKYFAEYTGIEVKQFRDTLLQHMGNVKKFVAERTRHQRQYDRRVNKRQMQMQESKVDTGKALDADLVVTESSGTESEVQDESNMSGNDTDTDDADIRPIYDEEPMAEYTEQCQIKSHMLDSLFENKTTEFSNHSLESENIWQHGQILNETSNKAKIKRDIDEIETINIELEHSVAKLLTQNEHLNKENETLKKNYKDLYDSIKLTRAKTIEQKTSLITQNANLKAQIQKKVFAIVSLKNELRKSKGKSVDIKFAKPSVLGKPILQPLRNQLVVKQPTAFKSERPKTSKPRFASQVDAKNNLSKRVTPHYFPKVMESTFAKPHHMTASSESRNSSKNMPRFSSNGMVHNHYLEEAKKKTQERDRNSKTSVMPSARFQSTADGSKPKPRSTNQSTRSLPTSKFSCVTITVVPKADHSRNTSSFSDSKHFVWSTC